MSAGAAPRLAVAVKRTILFFCARSKDSLLDPALFFGAE